MISINSFTKKRVLNTSSNGNTVIVNNGGESVRDLDTHLIFGQPFNGTQDVEGELNNVTNINASGTINADIVNASTVNAPNVIATDISTDNITADYGEFDQVNSDEGNFDDLNSLFAEIGEISGSTLNFNNGNVDNLTSSNINVTDLNVTGTAHFFQLVIDKIKAVGGSVILSPADGFTIDKVERSGDYFFLYWRAEHDGKKIANTWQGNDQALCQTINAATGTSYNVNNKFYWTRVQQKGTTSIEGIVYHFIKVYASGANTSGVVNPEIGDEIAMLGNKTDSTRQQAIYMCAGNSLDGTLTPPFFAQYQGVNDFNLSSHKVTWFAANGTQVTGNYVLNDGTPITDYITTEPQIILDSSMVTIYADANGQLTNINQVKGLPSKLQVKLGNTVIPTSEIVEGYDHSEILFQSSKVPLENSPSSQLTDGLNINTITKNANDYTFTYSLLNLYGCYANNAYTVYTVEFVHDGVTYHASKTLPTVLNKGGSYGDDGELFLLEPFVESAVVNANATLAVDFVYKIKHVIGDSISYETSTSTTYKVLLTDDIGGVHVLSFTNEPDYYNNSYFINYHTAASRPEYFTVELYDENDVIVDRRIIPIIFDASATLTISDSINATVQGNYQTLNNAITTNTNAISQLNIGLNSITSTVNGHTTSIDNLNGRVTQTEDDISSIEQTMTSITSTVQSNTRNINSINDELYELNHELGNTQDDLQDVTTRVSQVEQTAESLTSTVSETSSKLNNLLIGNKNYFGFSKNIQFENVIPSIQFYGVETSANSPMRISNIFDGDFESGDYTISCDIKTNSGTNYCAITLCAVPSDLGVFEINNTWQHFTFHYKIEDDNIYLTNGTNGRVIITNRATDKNANRIYIRNLKIERATTQSQFSISFEDAYNFGHGEMVDSWGTANINITTDENNKTIYTTTANPTSSTSISYIAKNNILMLADTPYTLSFCAKANMDDVIIRSRLDNNADLGTLQNEFISNHKQSITNEHGFITKLKLSTDWVRYNIHYLFDADTISYLHVLGINGSDSASNLNCTVQLKDISLQKGYLESDTSTNSSLIRQTAKDITLQVMGETQSLINLTENNILMQVENCGINIDEQNITLNGNTQINGSLTLSDDDERGFVLDGENGRTEILSKSIGTYEEFCNISSTDVNLKSDYIFDSDNCTFTITKEVGTFAANTLVKLNNQTVTFRSYNGGTIYQPTSFNATYNVYINNNLVRSVSVTTQTATNILNYTTSTSGLIKVSVIVNAEFEQANTIQASFNAICNVPTSVFTLIGNDGFASNFGNNSTVYFGRNQAVLKYGNEGLKINPNGIKKLKNNTWVNLNTMNVRSTNTSITLGEDEDIIIATNTSGVITVSLDSNVYDGRIIHFKSLGYGVQIRSQLYGIVGQSDKNPSTNAIRIDYHACYAVFANNVWCLFYCG